MNRKIAGPVLGISFGDQLIHVVAAHPGPNGGVEVTNVASVPTPAGAMGERATIQNPALITAALRNLLREHRITTRAAVLGLPSRAVFSRLINLPPMPDRERGAVVRGEIDHLNIMPPGQGTFDYALLARPDARSAPPSETASAQSDPVLFYAVEQPVVEEYRQIAQDAGLIVVGIEPTDYAAIRTIYPRLADKALALAVSLGSNHTNLLFFQNGRPVYARRLDVGIQEMSAPEVAVAAGEQAPSDWQLYNFSEDAEPLPRDVREDPTDKLGGILFDDSNAGHANVARQRLATEIGRSLDYFGREYVGDIAGMETVLLPNDLNLAGMPVYVTAALEHEVDFAYAFEHVRAPDNLLSSLLQEEGVGYAPALGLALGPLGGRFAGMPVFDLSSESARAALDRQGPRVLALSAACCVVALVIGGMLSFTISRMHAPVRTELAEARVILTTVSAEASKIQDNLQQQEQLVSVVRSQNLPWTNVLRHLSMAVPPGVGLTTVTVQGNTTLSITAETTDPRRIPLFWQRMNESPFFTGSNVNSMMRGEDKITIQMSANLPAAPAPKPAGG